MQETIDTEYSYSESYYKRRIDYFDHPTKFYTYRLDLLGKLCEFKGNERVLNIGCGMGTTEIEFAGRYGKMVGIDHNFVPLRMAQKLASHYVSGSSKVKCCFVNTKAESLPFGRDSFDMVICADFVEHVPRNLYLKLLKEVHYVLKKNGIFIIYAPSAEHILEHVKKVVKKLLGKQYIGGGANYGGFLIESLKQSDFDVLEYSLQPTHLIFLQPFERFFIRFQKLKYYFGRRICLKVAARKP